MSAVTYEVFILSKTDMLTIILRGLTESGRTLFINEIDKWDWEIENTLEGYAQLSEGVVLARDSERRVSVKSSDTQLAVSLKALIDAWNMLIETTSVTYSHYSQNIKREISAEDIDFSLYLKEFKV